jgi:hypothetical protein
VGEQNSGPALGRAQELCFVLSASWRILFVQAKRKRERLNLILEALIMNLFLDVYSLNS